MASRLQHQYYYMNLNLSVELHSDTEQGWY